MKNNLIKTKSRNTCSDIFLKKLSEEVVDTCKLQVFEDDTKLRLVLRIELDSRFISERVFPNTCNGRDDLDSLKNNFKNKQDFKKFFGV